MKKFTIGFIAFIFLLSAQPQQANALTVSERKILLKQIASLTEQVIALQQLVLERNNLNGSGGGARVVTDKGIYESRFYTGNYEAVYAIKGTAITPMKNAIVRIGDERVWNTYVDLVGKDFIQDHLVEFRIFNDEDNVIGAFIEQKPNLDWMLAINRLGEDLAKTYDGEFMVELLLHESAHIPFFTDEAYKNDFMEQFWSTRTMRRHKDKMENIEDLEKRTKKADDFYESHSTDFVSSYAATSPMEDIVESFVAFVVSSYPKNNDTQYDKIRFFYDYPKLVSWRKELRGSGVIDVE